MGDPGLERRIVELERRMAELADRRDAYGGRLVQEFRELQAEVDRINERGAQGTQWALKEQNERIRRLEDAFEAYVARQDEERTTNRRTLRTALIGAVLALAVALTTTLIELIARALSRGSP